MTGLDLTDEDFGGMPNPKGIVATNVDAKPDQAAAAVNLGKTTGIPAQVIYPDVEGFQQKARSAAAGDIVNNNPQLRDYVNSDPMKAKVSADDWGNLDAYSEAQQAYPKKDLISGFVKAWAEVAGQSALVAHGAVEGYDLKGQVSEFNKLEQQFPLWHGSLNPLIEIGDTANRLMQGGFGGITAGLQNIFGDKLGAEFSEFGQLALLHEVAAPWHMSPEMAGLNDLAARAKKLGPYLDAGKVPRGLDPVVDEWRKKQGIDDLDKLKESFKAAQSVQTKELVPEFFKDFAEQHTGEDTVGIHAETAKQLYGDKIPEEGDGLLGFVPDMAHQLEVAKETGADVQVPIAQMMAHMDPEVFKQVENGIRTRPDGFTKDEEPLKLQADKTGPNYPDPEIGQEFLGFYNIHSPELSKSTGAAGPHDVPEWYHPLKEIVDQLASNLGLPVTPRLWVGEHNNPGSRGYADSQGHIVLNSSLNPEPAVATTLHEVGHQVHMQLLDHLPESDKWQITAAWARDRKLMWDAKLEDWRPLGYNNHPAGGFKLSEVNRGTSDYIRSYNEWFAEQVQRWLTKTEEPKNFVDKFFKGIADSWRKIYERITGHQGVAPEVDEFLRGIWKGEPLTASNQGGPLFNTPRGPMPPNMPPMPKATGLRIFTDPSAMGMTKTHWELYQKAMRAQNKAEYEAQLKKAVAAETKHQSLDWKQKRNVMMGQVIDDFAQIPRFIADKAIREGEMPKINVKYLTEEEKAALPRSYYGRDGADPSKLASYFGYDTPKAMIDDLSDLHKNRGNMSPEKYVTDLVQKETDRRMEAQHGDLKGNILEAAKQQIVGKTSIDTMHAEIEAMAAENGHALPYDKKTLLDHVQKRLDGMRLPLIDSDRFITQRDRVSQSIEDALLKGDSAAAFRQRQFRYMNTVYAKGALEVEKAKTKFDKTMKKFGKDREVTGIRQEYTDQIHLLMNRLGIKSSRPLVDIKSNMEKGGYEGLRDFAEKKFDDGTPLRVPEFLLDPSWNKNMSTITGGEFKDVADLVTQMYKHGRDSEKIFREGKEFDRAVIAGQMRDSVKALRDKPKEYTGQDSSKRKGVLEGIKSFGWSLVQVEKLCERIDKGDFTGVWTRFFARPGIEAANYVDKLKKESAKAFLDMGDFEELHKPVDSIFPRPDGEPGMFPTTRAHVIGALSNMGNLDNFNRMVEGHGVDPETVKAWVKKNTTKEDWVRMQAIGKEYDKLFDLADKMSYEINELGIKKLELGVVDNPFGLDLTGWYSPVAHDMDAVKAPKLGKQAMPLEVSANGVEGQKRYYADTDQRYTKDRTKFRAPILLDPVVIPIRMGQMINDIGMRPAITHLNKFINDKQLMADVRNYHGRAAEDMLKQWVKDLAGANDADPVTLSKANNLAEGFLRNIAAAEIGFSISTVAKHGASAMYNSALQVGPINFAQAAAIAGRESPEAGKSWWKYAVDKSEELQRRSRLTPEALAVSQGLKFPGLDNTPMGKAKALAQRTREWGTSGVATADLASAVPTWIAEYRKWSGDLTEGEAIARADKAVRDAHGSSSLASKPEFMREKNPYAKSFGQFYGFFNEMYNKNYEMGWRAKEAWGSLWDGDLKAAGDHTMRAANILSRMVIAGLVEEYVSGKGDPREGWMAKTLKGTLHAFGATLPAIRDIVQAIHTGRDPDGALFAAGFKSYTDLARDFENKSAGSKPRAMKIGRDLAMATSTTLGIPLNHPVRAGEFFYNYFHGQEHPKTAAQWVQGISHGTVPK